MKNYKAKLKELSVPLVSLIILTFLILQAVASFRILCPPRSLPSLSSLRILCAPSLYPFLDYPMYSYAAYEGATISQPFVFGILEDSIEVPILPKDLGLRYWLFMRGFVKEALLSDNHERTKTYVELYQRRHNKTLIGVRLENYPLVLSREGVSPAPSQVVKAIWFTSPEGQK